MRLPRLAAVACGLGLAVLAAPTASAASVAPSTNAAPAQRPDTAHTWIPGFAHTVHLTTSISGPMFGDDADEMYYAFTVRNLPFSRTSATDIVLKTTVRACSKPDLPVFLCEARPTIYEHIDALAPGQSYDGLIPIALPNNAPEEWLRVTAEVAHVDEWTVGEVPGICLYGLNPSPLCASAKYDLLP
jgi:hypothetical protein